MVGTQRLTNRVYRALKRELSHLSSCLAVPRGRWVGLSTYLTTSPGNPAGSPSTAIAVANTAGELTWRRTFNGETFALAPDNNTHLMVASDGGIEILDINTGRAIARLDGKADASYVAPRELATIDRAGHARWLTY